jgi:DMSO/TMAO reductase YedYZ molybdopterin-dependent catalytic subunit
MRQSDYPGMVVRQKLPLNLECQFSSIKDWLTPTSQFFIRSHFPAPTLDIEAWRLRISGEVEKSVELSMADISAMNKTTFAATVECAGNGRVFYEPAKEGLQWQTGAVGNASWTGVFLRDVLELARPQSNAAEVVLIGADRGSVDAGKKTASPGPIAYARSIPINLAMSDAALLAYAMNDEPLSEQHGFPVRAVVGGWFGMAWVKWIAEIRIVDRPFMGYWQARDYFHWERDLGEPTLVPLTEMPVKAQIARPITGSEVVVNERYRVYGAAWSGSAPIARVEFSSDGGEKWSDARLLEPESEYAWRLWEYQWTPEEPGRYLLLCRATDTMGNIQPAEQQSDRESYMANWIVPVEVIVIESPDASVDSFVI